MRLYVLNGGCPVALNLVKSVMVILKSPHDFEDFVFKTHNVKNPDELFRILTMAVKDLGYDRIIFSVVNDRDLIPSGKTLGLFHS